MVIQNKVNGETFRILECTDYDEYRGLTGPQREWYGVIISAVVVDMTEGSKVQTALYDMFPENTLTGQALRDPANGLVTRPAIQE